MDRVVSSRRWHEPAVVATAALIIGACSIAPIAALAVEGIGADALDLLGAPSTWRLLGLSLATSAAVTLLAVAIGVPLGCLLARTDVHGRRVLLLVHALPMFMPPFLLALGWFHIAGRDGWLGGGLASQLLFARPGVVWVLGLAFAPIVSAMTVLGLDGIDPARAEAARLVAPPRRVITHILLPIAAPSIALAALVVLALAFAELGVPMFLRVPAYPSAVFARLGGISYAPGEAFVLVLPQLAVACALLAIEGRWIGRRAFDVLGVRREQAAFALGRWRLPATLACALVALLGLLPLAALAGRAAWGGVWAWAGDSIQHSLLDAAVAASVMTACGIVLGHALARARRLARALDVAALLAFITPAAALGAGLIAMWSRPETQLVYATSAIVIVGYVARYAVLGVRPLAIAFARGTGRLEDAAATAGAGYLRRIARIVIPVHARAIAATWLVCAVFCLRDLETAVLYYPPGRETLPVRIFTLEANGPPGSVAALATLHVAITALVVGAGLFAVGRRGRAR